MENSDIISLLSELDVIIYKGNPDWSVDVISGSEKISGYALEEFKSGKINWIDIIHKDDVERVLKESEILSEKPIQITQYYRIITKSGEVRYVVDQKKSVFDNGKFLYVAGSVRDITEKRVANSHKSSDIFSILTDFIDAAVFIFSGENFAYVNKKMVDTFGYFEDEFYNKLKFWDIIHPDYREIVKVRGFARQKGEDVPAKYEVKLLTRDGRVLWSEYMGKPVIYNGKPSVIGTAFDITERKELEFKLKETVDMLNRAEVVAKFGCWELNLSTGKIYGSVGARRIYGIEGEEFEYEYVKYIPLLEYRPTLDRALKNLIENGEKYEVNFKIKDASNGEIKDVFSIATYDAERNTVFGILVDVTEHMTDKRTLEESEAKFRALTNTTSAAIFVYSGDKFIFANNEFEEVTGYSPEEIVGAQFWSIVHPEYMEMIRDRGLRRQRGENIPNRYEFKIITKNGEERWVDFTADRIMWDGKPAALGTAIDITEKKLIEEKLRHSQKLEALGRLAGGVAHEYNNMMTIILNYIELSILKTAPESELKEYLMRIRRAAEHAADITRQLLSFARKQPIRPVVIDLKDFFDNHIKMFKVLVGENIDVIFKSEENINNIKADATQLNQVMTNLLINAKDAIKGIGKIEIKLKNIEINDYYLPSYPGLQEGQYVLISVSDTGEGIKKELLDKIFEPFFTTKDVGKGTGLGLATVFGIVKQNKGNIYVESEEGVGTTFKIFLPAHFEGNEFKSQVKNTEFVQGQGEGLLLVEDEESVLDSVKSILEMLNYKVFHSASPLSALELLQTHKDEIKLIITDMVMPEMDGLEFAKRAREINPDIKIIFSSGHSEKMLEDMKIGIVNGSFIQKPYDIRDLTLKIYNELYGK
ncbi:PAS domain S-box protein [Deferribacterales bacterium Es71-Z0220]|jgi:PAS domain S-box-containing protein|uniref:hybrid sensor histidine kinase/response regulator n=1 Tax=Deferrivibrio essentukiensis TaxID=2880922 RepID=UPI001F608376|nr:PAS domain-containing sensor histidine kinase [Deferrivibrio essentukiensis]MBZ4671858.1 sensor hybrid histidine kinase [Deferribacteraceae bacterium]MCB4203776.1 PAS domain S-box protein [Deferrivibrio essentukiensis]